MKLYNSSFRILLLCFLFLQIVSCRSDKKIAQANTKVNIPVFNEDLAYNNIKNQLDFGYRVPGTAAHAKCKDWLYDRFEQLGFEMQIQNFNYSIPTIGDVPGFNIVARHKPNIKERLLLCAHWDSRYKAEKDTVNQDKPIYGADDGASGVGVLIELARLISENDIPMGVDIVLFDMEDQGENGEGNTYSWGVGAQHFSKNLPDESYLVKYGILLDMVGAEGAVFPKEGFSYSVLPQKVNQIWSLAAKMNKSDYFVNRKTGGIIDDHWFVYQGTRIPVIDIINMPGTAKMFGDYHHTHNDNIDVISKKTLKAVGQVVTAVVFNESNKQF